MSSDEYSDDDDESQELYPRSSSLILSNGSSLLDNSATYSTMSSNSLIAGMNNSGGTSLILQPNLSLKQQQDLRQKRRYTRRKNPEERKRRGPRAKDMNAPRMPLNGYVRFLNANRERVKQENPELSFADVTKKLAAEWSSMDPETKKSYLEEAEKEKEIYLRQLHEYQRSESYQEFMEMKQRAKLEQQVQQKNLLNLMPTQNFSSPSNQSHSSQQPIIYFNDQTSNQQNLHHNDNQNHSQHQQYSAMNNQSHIHTQSQHHSYGLSPPSSSSSSLVYHNSNHGKYSLVIKKGSNKMASTTCTNSSPSNSSASSSNYQSSYSLNNSQYYGSGSKIHLLQNPMSNSPNFYSQKNKKSMIASSSDAMPMQSTSLMDRQIKNSSIVDPYRSFNTFDLSQSQTSHINSTSSISNKSNVEETNALEKMLEKLPPNSVIDLPIFTEEFLEHNKIREQELRNLRSFMLDYEETNAISSKHIDDMLKANEKLEKEEEKELETYNRLKIILDRLQQAIVEHLSGNISRIPPELIPSTKDNDNNLEYGPVTLENLDKFMDTLLKVRKNFNQKYLNDNPSLFSIRQQFLSSIRTAITSMDEIII